MLFPTLTFGLFFLGVYAVTWSVWSNEWRKILLLLASWIFYGAWDWRFVALLIASAILNWGFARLITLRSDERARKALMVAGVLATDAGPELLSPDPDWPCVAVAGRQRPDVLA